MTSPKYIQWMVHLYQKLAEQVSSGWGAVSLRCGKQLKLLQLELNPLLSHYSGYSNQIKELIAACWYECTLGECSSAVERYVHIVDVTGSIPVTPTTPRKYPSSSVDQQPFVALWPRRLAGLRPDPFRVSNKRKQHDRVLAFHPTT